MVKPPIGPWRPEAAPAGCLLYLPMLEGAGPRTRDASPARNDAALVGTPSWQPGPRGPMLGGFSTSSYLQVDPAVPFLGVAYPWWIAVLALNDGTGDGVALSAGAASGSAVLSLRFNTNGVVGTLSYRLNNGVTVAAAEATGQSINGGLPHVVMGVSYGTGNHQLYLDGRPIAQAITSMGTFALPRLTVGCQRQGSNTFPFPGSVVAALAGAGSVPDPGALAADLLSGRFAAVRPPGRTALFGAAAASGSGGSTYPGSASPTLGALSVAASGSAAAPSYPGPAAPTLGPLAVAATAAAAGPASSPPAPGPPAKPIAGTPLDWADPLTRGLVLCVPYWERSGNAPVNVAGGQASTSTNAANLGWAPGAAGTGRSSGPVATAAGADLFPTAPFAESAMSVEFRATFRTFSGLTDELVFPVAGHFNLTLGGGKPQASFAGGIALSAAQVIPGRPCQIVATVASGGAIDLYVDGALAATATGGVAANLIGSVNALNQAPGSTHPPDAVTDSIRIWNRVLSPAEVGALHADPWRMFARRPVRRSFSPTPPAYPGALAPTLGPLSLSAGGSAASPSDAGSSAPSLGPLAVAAIGSASAPTSAGSASPPPGSIALAAAGLAEPPGAGAGSATVALGPLTIVASGTAAAPTDPGTAAPALGSIAVAAAGSCTPPGALPFPSYLVSTEVADVADPFGIDPRRTTVELI